MAEYLLSACYRQDWEARDWEEGYIEMLGVLPEYVETQVAPALFTNALRAYQDDGMDYAAVSLVKKNPTEIAKLYTKLGFETTGESTIWMTEVVPSPSAKNHNLKL